MTRKYNAVRISNAARAESGRRLVLMSLRYLSRFVELLVRCADDRSVRDAAQPQLWQRRGARSQALRARFLRSDCSNINVPLAPRRARAINQLSSGSTARVPLEWEPLDASVAWLVALPVCGRPIRASCRLTRGGPTGRFATGRRPTGRFATCGPAGRISTSGPAGRIPTSGPAGGPAGGPASGPAGRVSTSGPAGRIPTSRVPTSRRPAGRVSTSRRPAGRRPTSRVPTGRRPTSRVPTGRRPTSCVPTGRRPAGCVPTSCWSTGRVPTSRVPTSRVATCRVPTSRVATCRVPTSRVATSGRSTSCGPTTRGDDVVSQGDGAGDVPPPPLPEPSHWSTVTGSAEVSSGWATVHFTRMSRRRLCRSSCTGRRWRWSCCRRVRIRRLVECRRPYRNCCTA